MAADAGGAGGHSAVAAGFESTIDRVETLGEEGGSLGDGEPDDSQWGKAIVGAEIDGLYRVGERVGEEGIGRVYEGVQTSVDRPVTIKLVRTDLAFGERVQRRFDREARVLSELDHPNLLGLVDFGESEEHDCRYLICEPIEGRRLDDLVGPEAFEPALALEVVEDVCAGLAEAHAADVIHRDLRPENLALQATADGDVRTKVLDFGVVFPEDSNTRLTETGGYVGTPRYLPPEVIADRDFDHRADLYSVGVILFELLTGTAPFEGDTPIALVRKHLSESPPTLEGYIPDDLLAELEPLYEELMAKVPEDRPGGSRQVRDRVRSIRQTLDLQPVTVDLCAPFEAEVERWLLSAPAHETMDGVDDGQAAGAADDEPLERGRGTNEPAELPSGPRREPSEESVEPDGESGAGEESEQGGAERRGLWALVTVAILASLLAAAGWWMVG